jgi:phosphoserine phosphatase
MRSFSSTHGTLQITVSPKLQQTTNQKMNWKMRLLQHLTITGDTMKCQQTYTAPALYPMNGSLFSPELHPVNWDPGNYSTLNKFLEYHSKISLKTALMAVFDFDNTSLYGNVGKTVFHYQLTGLHFRLSPEEFSTLFPKCEQTLFSTPFSLRKSRIVSLYKVLWPFIFTNQRVTALQLPEYKEFHTLLSWYCDASRRQKELGPEYSVTFLTRLLAGYTVDEVEELSCRAFVSALYEPVGVERKTVRCSDAIGSVEVVRATGLQVQREIVDLMNQLRLAGIHCSIVSASTEWIVKAAVLFFDFPVEEENIFGIRVRLTTKNVLSSELPGNYPVTYRKGKVTIINKFLEKQPILVAGDAETDFEMLTMP